MDNITIGRILGDYADLLSIGGGDLHRIRSYRRAAQTIAQLDRPAAAMVEAGEDLRQLPGIGSHLARHVEQIVRTGTFSQLEEISERLPRSLAELTAVRGLRPQRIRELYEKHGIRSREDLKRALDEGRLASLRGLREEDIRRSLSDLAPERRRFRRSETVPLVEPLLEYLRRVPGVERIESGGSYRRRKDTIRNVDLVASSKDGAGVFDRFDAYPGGRSLGGASIALSSGIEVRLHVVPPDAFGSALYYLTGSRVHLEALERLAPEARRERIAACRDEEELFRELGLPWIPPELREGRGEIEAAREGKLPRLLVPEDIRGDLHMHSTWSDGRNSIEEMVRACRERGYEYCAITDHSRSLRIARGLDVPDFQRQREELERVRRLFPEMQILWGAEVDVLPDGSLDLPDEMLDELDVVIASVHMQQKMPKEEMTRRILKALDHPAVDILGHPTGRRLHRRDPMRFDWERVFRAAKENQVALELNAQSERLDLDDENAFRARERGIPLALDTDSHRVHEIARFLPLGVDQARRAWLEKKDVITAKSWPELQSWLERKKG